MANIDGAFGLKPIRHISGAPYSGSGNIYYVPSTNSQKLAPGDPVNLNGTGDAYGIPGVQRATAGGNNGIVGVVLGRTNGKGVLLQSDDPVLPTSTAGYLLVEDNPHVLFEAQMSAAFAVSSLGQNASLLAGNESAGKSGFEVNSSGLGNTSSLQLKILRVSQKPNNEIGTNNTVVEVMINNHTLTSGTSGN